MAEAIAALGVIASVAQLADYGFKLSIKLYSFSEAVYTADKSIRAISNDVSLTSTVLKELCQIIKSDDAHVVSENAILATKQTVDECLKIFGDLDEALSKSLSSMGKLEKGDVDKRRKVNRGTAALEKLKWPFKQPKMELLRSNLDRLKTSLTLMLQVLSYARDVSNRKETESSLEYQKQIIESLARSERAMKRRYYALQHALEDQSSLGAFNASVNTSVNISTTRDIDEAPPSYRHPSLAASSSIPVGELLLCFRLIHDLLERYPAVTLSDTNYEAIREALVVLQEIEVSKIEKQYSEQPAAARIKAMRNIQHRLQNLVRTKNIARRLSNVSAFKGVSSDSEVEEIQDTKQHIRFKKDVDNSPTHIALIPVMGGLAGKPPSDLRERPSRYTDKGYDEDTVSDPLQPLDHEESQAKRLAALQTEIDDTVAIMHQNINKVSERGERLDSLHDRTDNLSVSAKNFRRGANRIRVSPWMRAYRGVTQGIAYIGSESYKSIQGLSESIYEAGLALFSEPERYLEDEQPHSPTPQHQNLEEDFHASDEFGDDSIVDELLSQWTTLPAQHSDTSVKGSVALPNT
ncbi:hypothetical protein EG329_011910 [Mollisiaceae sp. DMI_Dod_QoI]|nr:hypothetical protein EG329_011910 [Helotiales sp. DMI_Dod_QoI]